LIRRGICLAGGDNPYPSLIFCAPAVETAPAKHAKPAFAGWGCVGF